jgi:hypothetical protein
MKYTALMIGALLLAAAAAQAQPTLVGNPVPDWNCPCLADANLADPGPINVVNNPLPNSPVNAWCVPTATANIAGYYRDLGVGGLADAFVFPTTSARPAVDWRDDTLDTLTAAPAFRQDIGWYMNTNNIGDPVGVPIVGAMTGTHYANIEPGLRNYLTASGVMPPTSVVTYSDSANPVVAGLDTSGPGGAPGVPPRNVPLAYLRIVGEIDADRPLLLHVSHWNLANRKQNAGPATLPVFDDALWGTYSPGGPGGEEYSDDIGHTVTVVGYWNGGPGPVANHPFSGMAGGGVSTPDAVIVYDNTDGTLAGPTRPLPLVLPFAAGDPNPLLNVPWVMQTEISNVPEPATMALLGLGVVGLAALRRRKRH